MPQPKSASIAKVTPENQMVRRREMERWAGCFRGKSADIVRSLESGLTGDKIACPHKVA